MANTKRNEEERASVDSSRSPEDASGKADPEKGPDQSEGAPASPRQIHGIVWTLVVISTVSSILLYSLDNTITANILPPVINDLGNVDQLAWISVGFMIGGLCVALPYGKLYGLFNAKWLYIGSNVLFMVGSALCGAAPNLACLIVGRVIAGAGGNGMYVGVLTIISVNTSNKERPTYLSLIGLTYGLGTVLGPIIGGAFAESGASWRWGFYINLVIGGAFMPVYFFLVPSFDPRPGSGFFARLKLFDSIGAVLQAAGLLCGLMAINFGGTLYDWNSGQTIALFVVGGILLIVFSIQQVTMFLTSFEGRMFPVQMLKMKQPVLLFILMAANNSSAQALMYHIPVYFQFTREVHPLSSGVRLLPVIIAITLAIFANGALMSATGWYSPWYVIGSALILIGGVLMSRITVTTHDWAIYGFQIIAGVGIGAFLQAGYAVIQAILSPEHLPYAITFLLFAQLLGISIGVSSSFAVFVNSALNGLSDLLPGIPRGQLQGALSGTSGNFFSTFDEMTNRNAINIIVASVDKAFIFIYVAGAIALVTSVFLNHKRLNMKPPTE